MGSFDNIKSTHLLLLSQFAGYGNDFKFIRDAKVKAKLIVQAEVLIQSIKRIYEDNQIELRKLKAVSSLAKPTLKAQAVMNLLEKQNQQLAQFQKYWIKTLPAPEASGYSKYAVQ